jgi:hypothetical protein
MATDAQRQLLRILLRKRGLYESEVGRGLSTHMRRRAVSLDDASKAIVLLRGEPAPARIPSGDHALMAGSVAEAAGLAADQRVAARPAASGCAHRHGRGCSGATRSGAHHRPRERDGSGRVVLSQHRTQEVATR